MNEILVTSDDFRLYVNLSPNIDFNRLTTSIVKAQRDFIAPAIGEALYYDLYTNQEEQKYIDLLNGKPYTKSGKTLPFYGLKASIVLYSYAVFINSNDMRVTRTGNKVKNSEVSDQATPEMIGKEYSLSLNEGAKYLRKVFDFIECNKADYPLYEKANAKSALQIRSTGHSEFGRGSGWSYGANGKIIGNYGD